MTAPTLTDGVVTLDEFGPGDVDAHLANEDEEMARRFGWWPQRGGPAACRALASGCSCAESSSPECCT